MRGRTWTCSNLTRIGQLTEENIFLFPLDPPLRRTLSFSPYLSLPVAAFFFSARLRRLRHMLMRAMSSRPVGTAEMTPHMSACAQKGATRGS